MGGSLSSGQNNDELVDNLRKDDYIKTSEVEQVFRMVDRAHYYLEEYKDSAYKDMAWKCGTLHVSAPCIYSAVMEALDLKKGMSFLNLGSGTGYLNTMVGFMLGPHGTNHGIELYEDNVTYARKKLEEFTCNSRKFDDLEFCEPEFVVGNCLAMSPESRQYDRVYCGASCPVDQRNILQNMLKVDGILVVPVGDQLLKICRTSETDFTSDSVLPVSFASLILPERANTSSSPINLPELNPLRLQCMCGITVRESIRANFDFELPPPRDDSDKSPMLRKTRALKPRFFRPQRGRHPLDIIPTAQGLMIVGAFGHNNNLRRDDSSDEEEDVDDDSFAILDRQLQQHALMLRRNNTRINPGRGLLDPQDVDSDLSDADQEMGFDPLDRMGSNRNQASASSTKSVLRSDESTNTCQYNEDGVIADDEEEPDNQEEINEEISHNFLEKEDHFDSSVPDLTFYDPPENLAGPSSSGLGKRTISVSSDEEHPIAASRSTSEAVEMSKRQPSTLSQPRPIKSMYSTSSDTSGFGSLGEDMLPPSLPLSYSAELENISDSEFSDIEAAGDGKSGSNKNEFTGTSDFMRNNGDSKTIEGSSAENDLKDNDVNDDDVNDSHNDDDDIDDDNDMVQDDSSDAGYMDAEDEGEDSDDDTDDDKKGKAAATAEEYIPRGPNFSLFLKEKVDTLPIPNSIKAFILHYR